MTINLYNFGLVKHFVFDTEKDFTIIFGKNNTGKSYAISAVYLIIKNLLHIDDYTIYRYLIHGETAIEEKVKSYQKKLDDKKSISIKDDIETTLSEILSQTLLKDLNESFKNTFDSIENVNNKLAGENFEIIIETKDIKFTISVDGKTLYISNLEVQKDDIQVTKSQRNLSTKYENNKIKLYTSKEIDKFADNILELIISFQENIIFDIKKEIKNIYYLPASRSGLYQALSAFGQIIAELSKSRKFTSKKVELPSISEPLSDYFLELSNINTRRKEIKNNITDVAEEIEKNILNGRIEFDNTNKKIMFKPKNTDLKLDLSFTSSMVSEISPIVSYLRYVLNYSDNDFRRSFLTRKIKFDDAKPLIIIEEPEAHLHPDIQVKLLKQFVELAKNDVKFIITTHSNYMFNKFNNLILGNEVDISRAESFLFIESKKGSDVKKLELDQYGIEDENFIDTAENLYNEKITLIESLNS